MKFQIDKAAFIHVLQRVQSITEKKTNMPILSNTLIRASEEQILEFSVTDLELSLRTRTGAQVTEPDSRCVSARKLLEVVRELSQEMVGVEILPSGRFSIRAGKSHFELASIPSEDFPHTTFYDGVDFAPCNGGLLRSCLTKTLYAVPLDEDPFSIAGLYCHPVGEGKVRFAASDGHRLACSEMPNELLVGLDIGDGIVIPRKGVQEILKILEKESDVSLAIYENCLLLKTSETVLTIQLLEAEFPDYRTIIPEERPFALSVEKEVFASALKRMAILMSQKWRHVRLCIQSGKMEMEAGDPDLGKADDVLDIDYEGEEFTVAFNIKYLLDAVQVVDGTHVRFEWVDALHGGVFKEAEDSGYLALIMPMVI